MQKVAFITGISKGIGKAIAELLLKKNYIVFGYSRTNTIKHPNFTFTKIDLSDLGKVQKLIFSKFDNSEVLLINNAARIGEIIPMNLKKDVDIINDYNLNIISPTILCAKFINAFASSKKIILNISSGAANTPIASWSTYCAAKSALDRLTNVIAEEKHANLTIFSIHPGIVDTEMQVEIRRADAKLFPLLSKFTNYYNNNELENTKIVAQKLLYIIQNHTKFHQNILSIRDVDVN
ncbi:MAG: SDR family NAD(P)-dependent oxidoreductase [Bacteroidota bacterium]|nr:SDR family NAD(P)-dependent oxidoreductase [Bacteroidota bacterium]MEC9208918.1 SDR family NAD(P)-dependent oxidoreductase [Bacteroidota bacterium]